MKSKHRLYKLRYAQVPWFVVVTAMLLVVAVFTVINGQLSSGIKHLSGQVSEGSYMVGMQRKENDELKSKLKLAATDDFIANEARTRHGFLAEGEIRFVVVNPEVLWGEEATP